MSAFRCGQLALSAAWLANFATAACADEPTYAADIEFLREHTQVIELADGANGRVAICPEYQGRVMTSTLGGSEGRSFGWINRAFIEAGKHDKVFNNYGGEDRFWLAPEAGQFALFFEPKKEQVLANWLTPPGLNEEPWQVISQSGDHFVRMRRQFDVTNAAGEKFSFEVTRTARMLQLPQFAAVFGAAAGKAAAAIPLVGFETDNTLTNRGPQLSASKGLVSIWTLGQFKPGPNTWIVVPYREGGTAELGPIVDSSYFFDPPADRLKIMPKVVLFKGDAQFRSKIGINPRRVRPILAAIDFDAGQLTLVSFSIPPDPAAHPYVNNLWHMPQAEPYVGDVSNSYNDGPPEPGAETLGGFFELETLSPAVALPSGQSLRHVHRTFHLSLADSRSQPAMNLLTEYVLGMSYQDLEAAASAGRRNAP